MTQSEAQNKSMFAVDWVLISQKILVYFPWLVCFGSCCEITNEALLGNNGFIKYLFTQYVFLLTWHLAGKVNTSVITVPTFVVVHVLCYMLHTVSATDNTYSTCIDQWYIYIYFTASSERQKISAAKQRDLNSLS